MVGYTSTGRSVYAAKSLAACTHEGREHTDCEDDWKRARVDPTIHGRAGSTARDRVTGNCVRRGLLVVRRRRLRGLRLLNGVAANAACVWRRGREPQPLR